MSERLGSPYRVGRADCWIKVKNPAAPAVKREAGGLGPRVTKHPCSAVGRGKRSIVFGILTALTYVPLTPFLFEGLPGIYWTIRVQIIR